VYPLRQAIRHAGVDRENRRETRRKALDVLSSFVTNPAGSDIVNAVGPIRQVVRGEDKVQRHYLVIVAGTIDHLGTPAQVEKR
jgi:hypothetical protein